MKRRAERVVSRDLTPLAPMVTIGVAIADGPDYEMAAARHFRKLAGQTPEGISAQIHT